MKISCKVTAKARQNCIKQEGDLWRIHVTAAPQNGEANRACIKLLANHFQVPQRQVILLHGETSRNKVFLIEE